jgi:YHS domain-containing protein
MVDHHSLVAGDRHWGATHQERTYLFAGPDEQRRFLADPDRYAPVLAGNDPVRWFHEHKLVPGTRIHGLKYGGQIFLFADEHALKAFEASPERYADEARQAMRPRGNARR